MGALGGAGAGPGGEGGLEGLDKDPADVAAHPVVEDGAEELAEAAGREGLGGGEKFGLVGGYLAGGAVVGLAAVEAAGGLGGGGAALDQGDEPEVPGAGADEEIVNLARLADVATVDDGEGVEVDAVAAENLEAGHDALPGGMAAGVEAKGIVHLARAVEAESDEEVFGVEKLTPGVVEGGAVGLECVVDGAAGGVVILP